MIATKFGSHVAHSATSRQWLYAFDNGFGASVINDGYGRDQGLYELAVLDGTSITCDTPLTDDVLGYLDEHTVADYLDRIAALDRSEVTR